MRADLLGTKSNATGAVLHGDSLSVEADDSPNTKTGLICETTLISFNEYSRSGIIFTDKDFQSINDDKYTEDLNQCILEDFNVEAVKLYLESTKGCFNKSIFSQLKKLKQKAISEKDDITANILWCYQAIAKIQFSFICAFEYLKNDLYDDYHAAWLEFERIEIEMSFLRPHLSLVDGNFHLDFISRITQQFQSLYPYTWFISREIVIKKEKCSICGEIIFLRNRCKHRKGRLYNGEMCFHVVSIKDTDPILCALVQNPFDKYCVLFPKGYTYDYFLLRDVISKLKTPFHDWRYTAYERVKPSFVKAERNKPCPCGSDKKYKKCCMGKQSELELHYAITLKNNE